MNRLPPSWRLALTLGATSLSFLGLVTLASAAKDPVTQPSGTSSAMPVSLASVKVMEWAGELPVQGSVAAWQEAVMAARVAGVAVTEIHAAVGDRVRRGATLARLDDRGLSAERDRAVAEQARAAAALAQAQAEAQRTTTLKAGGAVSEQEWLAAQTARDLAVAQASAAEAGLRAATVKLEDTWIRANDDGLIVSRQAVVGQVPSNGAELFRMVRQNRLEWRAEVNAEQLARLSLARTGTSVTLRLPDGQTATGRLRQVSGALDASTRLGVAYVDILPGSSAKVGMVAAGVFALPARPGLTVPASAVQVREGRAVVFRTSAGRAQMVAVQTGRRRDEEVEVRGALREGERVVVHGAGFLRDGDTVQDVAQAQQVKP